MELYTKLSLSFNLLHINLVHTCKKVRKGEGEHGDEANSAR